MLLTEGLFLIIQILFLFGFNFILSRRRGTVVQKYFHPFAFISFFYFLFFIIPQFIAIYPPYELVGLAHIDWQERRSMISQAQLAGLAFLLPLMVVYYFIYTSWRGLQNTRSQTGVVRRGIVFSDFHSRDYHAIFFFFVIGLTAIVYLGITLTDIAEGSEGARSYRSELVKTTGGKITTAISYFGNFAFAVLFVNAILNRKWPVAIVLVVVFGGAILMTGSRGRLMWPLVLSAVMLMSYTGKVEFKKIIPAGLVGLMLLLLLDPLMKTIRSGDFNYVSDMLDFQAMFETMFFRRNFDGLSNLALAVHMDEAPKSLTYLFTGARDAFMTTYFPTTYAAGVGFGVSYPGWLFLTLGWPGLVIGGAAFGFVLGYIHSLLKRVRDIRLYWTYLFMMPWLCAVGGNFVESFDKMLAAIAPGILWILYAKPRGERLLSP